MQKQIFNPYLPSYEYIPDGEPHVWGQRLYIYGSHDRFNGTTYCQNDYVCWSTPVDDLSDWKYEGVIYKKDQHPGEGEHILFAPDVARGNDEKYYLYYSTAHSSVISVAVCDAPAGHYQYIGEIKDTDGSILGSKADDYYQFDPAVLVDGDRVFLYSGFCPQKEKDELGRLYVGCHVCELEQDMITVKEKSKVVISRDADCPEGARYFEAPSIRKINGLYYLVYSARETGLYYYYSKYPDREFVFGGKIHSSSDVGLCGYTPEKPAYPVGNTHGGIVGIKDQYFIFDHRFSNNSSFCRQGVAEPITFDKKGMIAQVEATSCGLNQGALDGKGEYPAYIACNMIDTNIYANKEEKQKNAPYITQDGEDRDAEPGQYLHRIKNGCVIGYKYFQFYETNCIQIRIRGNIEGKIIIGANNGQRNLYQEFSNQTANDFLVGTVEIQMNNTEWRNLSIPVDIKDGKHALYIGFIGKGEFDLLSFQIK